MQLTSPLPAPAQAERLTIENQQDRYHRAYMQSFLLALVICWSPLNLLAYLAPLIVLAWYIIVSRSGITLRNSLFLLSIWVLFGLLHAPFIPDYAWVGALLSILTFSSFLPILAIPNRFLDSSLYPRMQKWIVLMIVIQASLGIVQAIYGVTHTGSFDMANGDYVEGTIHPWLAAELSFSNPMFAVNMVLLLLAILPSVLRRYRYIIPMLLGLAALVLASVIHVLMFLAIAAGIILVLYLPILLGRRAGCLLFIIAIIITAFVSVVLPRNTQHVTAYFIQAVEGRSPRGQALRHIIVEMPKEYPLAPILGLGQGQFSSRSGMIATGTFFGSPLKPEPLPLLPLQESAPYRDHLAEYWLKARTTRGLGSTHQPLFSWLTWTTEMGVLAFLLLSASIAALVLSIRYRVRAPSDQYIPIALSIGILFIFFLGIQENYWEIPQAIFPGLLILKAMYAYWRRSEGERDLQMPVSA